MTEIEEWDDDVNDEDWSSFAQVLDPSGKGVRVASSPCSTCIFRPGNLMHLNPGRVKGMVEDVIREDTYTQCHKTLGGKPGEGMLCHGMTKRHEPAIVRFFGKTEVDPVE